ncbi:MAG: lipopolysaccharide assembly protein LapA domain-containing protein [Pseudonocardia sediminis]
MKDKRRDSGQDDLPAYGRVGPADPTADPATMPAMRVPGSEQATVAVPTGHAGPADEDQPVGDDTPTVGRPVPPSTTRTRISGLWAGLILSAIVGIFLLVFILQNTDPVRITFLWLDGSLPTGVALLFAAIAGILLVAIPGTARILQLRRVAKRGG